MFCSFDVVDGDVMNALFSSEAKRFLLGFDGFGSVFGDLRFGSFGHRYAEFDACLEGCF